MAAAVVEHELLRRVAKLKGKDELCTLKKVFGHLRKGEEYGCSGMQLRAGKLIEIRKKLLFASLRELCRRRPTTDGTEEQERRVLSALRNIVVLKYSERTSPRRDLGGQIDEATLERSAQRISPDVRGDVNGAVPGKWFKDPTLLYEGFLLALKEDNLLPQTCKLARIAELRLRWRQTRPEINQLRKQLKEAEYILATSIFQARQKLTSFAKATKRPVLSDELIKETSAGHTRRTEMRLGFLCNSAINGHQNPASQNNPGEINRTGAAGGSEITPGGFGGIGEITVSAQNQFAWHLSVELHMTMGGGSSIPLDTRAGGQDDVEVMSTDSSSSISSDSQ
ncbi:mediator complex [Culex quinquefasciatus]|uniref:Mediator complex n=1 Tax=Culex quinquefasciatus TaxID=7176 RepID=B0WNM3_CULQU|nr:mediator complex [Culex quinquefasciatus]|eukprot:XP_001850307.1 mediator complex [Culex quinquefasciatus]